MTTLKLAALILAGTTWLLIVWSALRVAVRADARRD